MKKVRPLFVCFFVMLLPSCSMAGSHEGPKAHERFLPLSVDRVETHRVGDYLLRFVKHNMEIEPRLDLELIDPGQFEGVDRLEVVGVSLDGEELNFSESAGAFVESIGFNADGVTLVLEYFYREGGADRIKCVVSVAGQKIGSPKCQLE